MTGDVNPSMSAMALLGTLAESAPGSSEYFRNLMGKADAHVRVGALIALLDQTRDLSSLREIEDALIYGAIRTRIVSRSAGVPKGYVARIAEAQSLSTDVVRQRRMLAELTSDGPALEAASGELYLATGLLDCLLEASQHAESHGGWRAALMWVIRAVVISPLDPRGYARLYSMLAEAGQVDLLDAVADILKISAIHPQIEAVFRAGVAQAQGRHTDCLTLLAPLIETRRDAMVAPMLGSILQLSAVSQEKGKDFAAAYASYRLLNESGRTPTIDAKDFYRAAEAREKLIVPALPAERREDVVQMTGFPRSGTTLLENVLAAHPEIETFEEIPALQAAYARIERAVSTQASPEDRDASPYLGARQKYFEELDLRRRKTSARVLVDKMPLRSVESAFLNKLFPQWRYIFSIRHPFDVALSCFKQRFQPNVAMENFRTIEDTARLYDFAMTQWFGQFSMESERVCYVRYEHLVLDFEPTVRRVLDFVGVDWNDDVVDFATAAENRAARTPSYQKVRQGLGIGVQTSWRNYRFLFDSKAADPLRKWVDFFGYEAT